MLSYRHSFHAGNFADVLKHSVQTLIIQSLCEKDKPFLYLDTHAGAGRYLLTSHEAHKTGEYLEGIGRLWFNPELPIELAPYLNVVKSYNNQNQLVCYPGSPLIAKQLLRPQDSLFLTELHPTDYPLLKHEFLKDKRTRVSREDGYQQLKSKLPPVSRRGFILIDPPYELKTDYQQAVKAIEEGYKRFATGIYALWYPVVLRDYIKKMQTQLKASGIRRILQIELAIEADNHQFGMTGTGLIVVNPPWKLEQQVIQLLPWLHKTLSPEGKGHSFCEWLVPE